MVNSKSYTYILVASIFEIILILLFLLMLFTYAYALYNTKVMYFPVGNSLFCFPEGPYIKCFAIYKQTTVVFEAQATVQWYPGRDTFEFN